MAIRGLSPTTVTQFSGKDTTTNLSDQALGTLTAATNTMILADGNVRRAPGYSVAVQLTLGSGPVVAQYEFIRSVDQATFRIYQRGTSVIVTDGGNANQRLLTTLASPLPLQFTQNLFVCYASNGVDAIRLVDVSGTLTAYQWGLTRPAFTPTLAIVPGTLTLRYGRNYVIAPVAKYTDSLGIERVHVGAPSPASAYSGPVTSSAIVLAGWLPPTDPQQTHWWVFATADSPDQTSATYYFAAELTAGTLSWADTLVDSALDQTRLAPFDNYPAPPASLVLRGGFQSVQFVVVGAQVRFSGGASVVLGIPDESWPLSYFSDMPAGARPATAITTLNSGTLLAISNGDTWFGYTGYDATTFTEQDRIASPGQAGAYSGCQTPFGYAFLSPSKRLWLWDGGGEPTELSSNVANAILGTVGMESITDPAAARLHWYSYGQRHVLVANSPITSGTWLGLWGVPSAGVSGPNSLHPTDKFPTDLWTCSGDVKENGVVLAIYACDPSGRVLRFPDTFLDAGTGFVSACSHAWIAPVEGRSRFYWIDFFLDCSNPLAVSALGGLAQVCQLSATVLEAPENTGTGITTIPVRLVPLPVPTSGSTYALRGSLQLPSLAAGRYIRWNLALATADAALDSDIVIQKVTLQSAPVYQGAP